MNLTHGRTCEPLSVWPPIDRPRPLLGTCVGAAGSLVIAAVMAPLQDDMTRAVPALLFLLPVVAAAILGGRIAGLIVVACAAIGFVFTLPPIGSPEIDVSEDVTAVFVFGAVAFVVSALVTTRLASLQQVDSQRRALLRSVSHDLRTPLSAIHAVATDLRDGAAYDAQTRKEMLDTLVDESERLDRLVANLLSMSRIEAGTLRPNLEAVDVDDVVRSCARRLERVLRGSDLVLELPEQLPLVRADHVQLEQVINNLLENAVIHTPAGTTVRVYARPTRDVVELVVADDGPGLPDDVRANFATADVELRQGLGLAISKAFVEAQGGTLTLGESRVGTRIVVRLVRAG
jgi:K+-sensing histidine kinase KdpD